MLKERSPQKMSIKSKKEKLNEKKQRKNKNEPAVIQVIQSDQQLSHVQSNNIDAKIIKDTTKVQKPNQFNLQRLKKIIPQQIQKRQTEKAQQNQLNIQICDVDQDIKKNNGRNLIQYKTQGSTLTKFTSINNIKQKINQFQTINKNLQNHNKSDSQEKNQKKVQDQNKNKNKQFRYFITQRNDQSSSQEIVKCFRCNQAGHISRNCPQEAEKIKCNFCLGEHHSNDCISNLCFKCGQNDHVAQNCKSGVVKCNNCNKVGHKANKCGTILFLDYHNKQYNEIKNRYSSNDLKRLKCLAKCQDPYGHFNCQKYQNSRLMPYQKVSSKKIWHKK